MLDFTRYTESLDDIRQLLATVVNGSLSVRYQGGDLVGTLQTGTTTLTGFVEGSVELANGLQTVTVPMSNLPFRLAHVLVTLEPEGDQSCGTAGNGFAEAYVDANGNISITAEVKTNTATVFYLGVTG